MGQKCKLLETQNESHQLREGTRMHGEMWKEGQKTEGWNSSRSILHLGDGLSKGSLKRESEKDGRKVSYSIG